MVLPRLLFCHDNCFAHLIAQHMISKITSSNARHTFSNFASSIARHSLSNFTSAIARHSVSNFALSIARHMLSNFASSSARHKLSNFTSANARHYTRKAPYTKQRASYLLKILLKSAILMQNFIHQKGFYII